MNTYFKVLLTLAVFAAAMVTTPAALLPVGFTCATAATMLLWLELPVWIFLAGGIIVLGAIAAPVLLALLTR